MSMVPRCTATRGDVHAPLTGNARGVGRVTHTLAPVSNTIAFAPTVQPATPPLVPAPPTAATPSVSHVALLPGCVHIRFSHS
jgi:hypothetical protein